MAGSPNSCIIKIEGQKYRALVDTGASLSILASKVVEKMKSKPKLLRKQVNLHSVDGSRLESSGFCEISFKIGGNNINHTFCVSPSVTRNVILGRDWMIKFGVRLYYDIPSLRIKGVYCPLLEDAHIASIDTDKRLASLRLKDSFIPIDDDSVISSLLRLARPEVLRPQSVTKCLVKVRTNLPNLRTGEIMVQDIDRGYMHSFPGLLVYNAIAKATNGRAVVYILNQSGRYVNLKRGTIVARGASVSDGDIQAVNAENEDFENAELFGIDETVPIDAPDEFMPSVQMIINKNRDVFAAHDRDLSQSSSIRMNIDTSKHPPIRLRPYKTPLNKRKVIENAVSEMLDAKVIERSNSPWSFPMVIVKKADGTNRPCIDYRRLNDITRKKQLSATQHRFHHRKPRQSKIF